MPSTSRRGLLAAAIVFALVIVAGVALLVRKGRENSDLPPARAGFREAALESGIKFRMSFLPNEQGEHFKINLYDHGCGVAVGDFDGDGHEDIYFCNQLGPNALYRNKGDGTFEDVTAKAGVAVGDRVCVAAVWADYDNDGRPDLFVTSTRGGNILFRNLGDGTFKDVTEQAGVAHVGHSQTATFFDYDNDGHLDLFVTNTAGWTTDQYDTATHYFPGVGQLPQLAAAPKEYNILYHNNGDGTFTDVTEKAGLKGKGWGGDVAVFDFDEDGHLDLLVTNMFGASQLYRNNGDGTFTDVTQRILGRTSWGAIGVKAFDFNNDGHLDLFIADMHSDMWMGFPTPPAIEKIVKEFHNHKYDKVTGPMSQLDPNEQRMEDILRDVFQIHYDRVVFGNTLFKHRPDGTFDEVSDKAGMETLWPWGVAIGDFDNDGYEDVFLPTGMGYPWFYWHNYLMMNNGNETFTDRATEVGIEPPARGLYLATKIGGKDAPRSSRCAAVADFDGDGQLDLITNNFNDAPYYFRNEFPKKSYVAFRLTGTESNRDAVGALVRLYAGKDVMVRQVQAAGGYLSQSSRTIHFGLGDRTAVDRIEIRWPRGQVQTIDHPAVNQLHPVKEPERKRS